MIVLRQMIDHARLARMQIAAAQILRAHHLAGRRLHQRRAAEEDGALVLHDHALVRHRRHIGAAGGARAHHHRDLRNAQGREDRLVVEDAAEVLAIGKHFRLVRQVGAARIDQIDAGQPVLACDLLRAQMLLHGHRQIGAAFDGGVVAYHHAFAALDAADAGDDAGGVDIAVIEAVGGKRRQLQERRARIDQVHHSFSWKKLSARHMPFARPFRAAQRGFGAARLQFGGKRAHRLGIGAELGGIAVDLTADLRHLRPPPNPSHRTMARHEKEGNAPRLG